MSEKNLLNDQELENVSGGEYRVVNTGDSRDAAIRSYPGLNAPVVATLPNGTAANTTTRTRTVSAAHTQAILLPFIGLPPLQVQA